MTWFHPVSHEITRKLEEVIVPTADLLMDRELGREMEMLGGEEDLQRGSSVA